MVMIMDIYHLLILNIEQQGLPSVNISNAYVVYSLEYLLHKNRLFNVSRCYVCLNDSC